ncbi:MAG: diadenylate cyclase CdaA [Salibacteraceae bacterium]
MSVFSAILTFITLGWQDVVDILLVAVLIYQLYIVIRGTVAIRIFLGIFAIYLFWKLVEALQMNLLSEILGQFIGVGVIALIIVFQQELRKFLLLVGTTGFSEKGWLNRLINWKRNDRPSNLDIEELTRAVTRMAEDHCGALIIISRFTALDMYTSGGKKLNALLSADLLESIFFKNSPLHDGAVLIDGNTILSASNVLPVSERSNLPGRLGMRHRAAIGITENTDGLAIVVSEETGHISLVSRGKLQEVNSGQLPEALEKELR